MKSFDEVVAERRSVRQYDAAKSVSREMVETLIKSAIEAPSWKNQQTSRYHVAYTPEMKEKLRGCLSPRNQVKAKDAPVLIVSSFIRGNVGFEPDGSPSNELGDGWGIYDLGLHNSLLLLKAADLGLDSLVMGLRDADAIRSLLDIPEEEVIVSVIAIGYRAEEPTRPPRKNVEDIAKFY